MKYAAQAVEFFGNLICAAMADVLTERTMPQILFQSSDGRKIRMVMFDNKQVSMSKEEVQNRIESLKAVPGKDIGFSYTHGGMRIVVVPEEMSITPVIGAPLGTPRG